MRCGSGGQRAALRALQVQQVLPQPDRCLHLRAAQVVARPFRRLPEPYPCTCEAPPLPTGIQITLLPEAYTRKQTRGSTARLHHSTVKLQDQAAAVWAVRCIVQSACHLPESLDSADVAHVVAAGILPRFTPSSQRRRGRSCGGVAGGAAAQQGLRRQIRHSLRPFRLQPSWSRLPTSQGHAAVNRGDGWPGRLQL